MEQHEQSTKQSAQKPICTTKTTQGDDLISRASRYLPLLLRAQAALTNITTESTTQKKASRKKSQICTESLKQILTETLMVPGDL